MAIDFTKSCDESGSNYGIKGCQSEIAELIKPFKVDPSLSLDTATSDLDQAALDVLICEGKVEALPEGVFTSNAEENVRATQGNAGILRPVRDGLFAGNFSFIEGATCLGNKLANLKNKKWGLWFADANGKLIVNRTSDGFVKPFFTSFVDKGTTQYNDGSNVTQYSLDFQLSKAGNRAWNENVDVYDGGIDWDQVQGVNDTNLTVTVDGSDISLTAILGRDGSTQVANQENNFRVIDTATNAPTNPVFTYDATSGAYATTGLSAGSYTIEFYDTVNSCSIVKDSEGCYYASNTATFTIV